MKIHVTQDHIDRGLRHSASACPVSLALAELTETEWSVGNAACYMRVSDPLAKQSLVLPAEAYWFINAFDAGFDVNPLDFDLPLEELTA